MPPKERPSLDQLAESYEIVAELSGRAGARAFLAKRRSDGADVLVTVAGAPDGDEGNALNHLAADTNLLKGRSHRALVRVLDGHWVGDGFAVVTEQPRGATLEELLARRDEPFDYPRIATVLAEVNGLLEWAREQKVVHRALDADSIFLEPGSDRVVAAFGVRPLPLANMPGPDDDARTIARLARAMLTRSAMAPERDSRPLAEVRPGLPDAVVARTETLLAATDADVPDVAGYIAAIAMADALKRGETTIAETHARLQEEERSARASIQAEQDACARAAERQQEEFAKERAALMREQEEMRAALAKEGEEMRAALAKERAALQREREEMLAELGKERRALLKVRDKLDEERSELAKKAGEIRAQHELYARTQELSAPAGADGIDAIPVVAVPEAPAELDRWRSASGSASPRRRAMLWGAGALVLLVAVALVAASRRAAPARMPDASIAARVDSAGGASVARVNDSAGEVTTDVAPATPTPSLPVDFTAGVASRAPADPLPVAMRPRPRRAQPAAPPDSGATNLPVRPDSSGVVTPLGRPAAVIDSLVRRDSVRRDSVRRDTVPRRDTLVRRDTMPGGGRP